MRSPMPEKWWIYGEKRPKLYATIKDFDKTLVIARTSKTGAFTFVSIQQVLNANLTIIAFDTFSKFCILQSTVHILWAWKYSTKLKTDLIYQPSDAFETYPFPKEIETDKEKILETIGEAYHEHRKQLILGIQLGLTKTYNLFHSNAITAQEVNGKDKQVAALIKHLEKTENTISLEEAIAGILKLRELHVEMDNAVLEAYGWHTDSEDGPAISLRHDFYEVDYLPENDRIRYTIHPEARKEVLKRLLALNHKIHEEEVKAGLWDKKAGKKAGKAKNQTNEPEVGYGGLFD